ncbi:zona pellucida sperm-binding protein 3-like [Centroberyx affinis]|uniref:zona pellucida sperm-binding protein 3-like n=1 Tax=Centroberyx affinis TaxID=166261 RepID=UPI003A5C6422
MDLQQSSPWWIIALLAVSTLTHCQYVYRPQRGSTTENSYIPNRFHNIQPEVAAVKQQQSAEPSARPPSAVVVTCHADSLEVVVQADLFDTGLLVDGRHLHLGSDSVSKGSACTAVPSGEAEFTIQAHLMDCGTKLSSTNEKLIYSNILVYSPEPSSDGVLRLDGATIPVECHYEKRYAVDGIALNPTWAPFVSKATAEDEMDFSLQLMTDDWQFQRGSHVYFLGDPIHLEVSVIMGSHMPLRVYVDHCVATATPDAEATLRYDFIEHYGCLADAYLTSSSSRFLPRVQQHKLRFQLEAFRFYQESSHLIYITCYVKAVPALLAVGSQNRACSFIENRWQSVDGNDEACRGCDVSQRFKEPQSIESPKPTIRTTTRPAITTQDTVWNRPKQNPANYFRLRPGMHQPSKPLPSSSSARLMKRGADSKEEDEGHPPGTPGHPAFQKTCHKASRFHNSAPSRNSTT